MQSIQKLTKVLRELFGLLETEASRNPAFAEKLELILSGLPSASPKPSKKYLALPLAPDVFPVLEEKGELEFRFWLRSLDLLVLRSIVKTNGFDPANIAKKWHDPDKYIELITEQTIARLKRGTGFLRESPPPPVQPEENT